VPTRAGFWRTGLGVRCVEPSARRDGLQSCGGVNRSNSRHRTAQCGGVIVSQVVGTLTANGQKARYGVAYLRHICAQAGVPMTETSPDEDVMAVDCSLDFLEASVRVQVKCSSAFSMRGRSASWLLEESWVRKWRQFRTPLYFVLVKVTNDASQWLQHLDDGTMHRTMAYWKKVEQADLNASGITLLRGNRLAAATLGQWHSDLLRSYRPGGDE
jgi:hypothetical protein